MHMESETHKAKENWFVRRTSISSESGNISMSLSSKPAGGPGVAKLKASTTNSAGGSTCSTPTITSSFMRKTPQQGGKRKPSSQLTRPARKNTTMSLSFNGTERAAILTELAPDSEQFSGHGENYPDTEGFIDQAYENLCVGCEIEHLSSKDSKTVQCELCAKSYCIACVGISPAEYPVLMKSSAFHWYCPRCEGRAVKSLKTEKDIEDRCTAFMAKMEGRVGHLESEITKKVDRADLAAEIRTALQEERARNPAGQDIDAGQVRTLVQEELEKLVWDKEERDKRKSNLILFKVPEPDDRETDEEKESHDQQFVECLLREQLVVNCPMPKTMVRLGDRSVQARPLMLVMNSELDRVAVLKRCYRLRHATEPFKSINVAKDMSKKDRDQHRAVLAEARAKDEEEESGDWRNIVKGPPGRSQVVRVRRTLRRERNES